MCVMYAQKIVALFEQPSDNELEFLKWLESTLTEMIGSYPENKVWQNFHQLRCTDHFKEQWEQYLENCNLCKEPIFYQHVTLKLFEEQLKEHMKRERESVAVTDDDDVESLTYEEENAVRYMCGYVVRKMQNASKHVEVGFLISDQAAASQMESSEWINLIDRGGLVHVTDDCFQLFLSMECAVRRNLNKFNNKHAQANESFSQYMESKLSSDDSVLFDWMMITGDEEEHRDTLHQMIKLWVTIRGHSFAKSVLEQYKQETKKATKK